MARGLSVALLLVAVAPVYTSQSSSPSVHHLDPSCSSGQQSCRGAVEDALLACKVAARPCVIALAAGTYLWNTTRGTVAAANLTGGLTILAEGGAVEIVTYGAVLGGLLHLQFVAPVLIRGPISVDTMRTPYTFGQVTSANATGFTVRFNESRYPFASNVSTLSYLGNASWLRAASHFYGAIDRQTMTPQLPMQWGGSGSISLGPGSGVLTVAYGRLSPQFVGEWLVLEHSREHTAFEFTHCGDVEIEGVSLRSNPGFGLMFNRCRDVALDGVELVAAGGRPMSIMADGAHFRQCSGRILVQNSRFERNGDDGFAVHGAYYQVTAVVSPACVILSGRESLDVVVGAEWEIRERMTMQVLSTSLRVASVDMSTSQVCFDASLPNALQPYDLLASLSRPSEVLIRNSTFWGNLGHGVRIKTDNATVTRCRLGYNSYMPILMIPDGAIWMSSGTVHNATVSHCYLERGGVWANAQYDVDATSITVTAYVPQTRKTDGTPVGSGPLASGMVNADIIIANNTVVQAPGVGTAFLFRATRNYAVVGNIVTWDATHAGNRLVHALNSLGNATSNICVSGNATMPC